MTQTPEDAGLFHGIEGAARQVVVYREQECLLLGKLIGLVHKGRHGCLPGLPRGAQALGARDKLQGRGTRLLRRRYNGVRTPMRATESRMRCMCGR